MINHKKNIGFELPVNSSKSFEINFFFVLGGGDQKFFFIK